MYVYSLVKVETVPNAVFHVDPNEVWLGRGEHLWKQRVTWSIRERHKSTALWRMGAHLCDKDAGDPMADAKEGIAWVRDGVLESLLEVARMREEGGPVRGKGVQVGLLVPRLGSHVGLGDLVF